MFRSDGTRQNFRYEQIGQGVFHNHHAALDALMHDLGADTPAAVGHRVVHGGESTAPACLINNVERERLNKLVALAPLHLPGNLLGIDLCRERFDVPQMACFDTAFHVTLPPVAQRLPIPNELGIRRYGFHGINYAYIAQQLPALLGAKALGKIVVAHLGNGASLCLLNNLQSVDTTMGYTPAGGIPMGTRSGDLDPGIMLALAARYTSAELSTLVYHRMGLLALSDGESSNMEQLLESRSEAACFAVDYFCYQICGAIGALAAKAGGIDALVFTAGIGEHAPLIREKICASLQFMGFQLDIHANQANLSAISTVHSKPVLIIPADEEAMMHHLVSELVIKLNKVDA